MFGGCAEVFPRCSRKRCYNIGVLVKTVSGIFDYREVTPLRGVSVSPVSIAEQMNIMESLLGMSVIASDFILGVLWNADASKDADDGNYNQQFYECEA